MSVSASIEVSSQRADRKPAAAVTISDEDLIERIQKGDDQAFRQVFDLYSPDARLVARKFLKNREDVKEVIQETFIDVHRSAKLYDSRRGSLRTWISYLAYTQSIKKHQALKKAEVFNGNLENSEEVLDSGWVPEEWIRQRDFRKCLDSILSAVDERQRMALQLYYLHDVEPEVIATKMGETWETARNLIYRGLAQLRYTLIANRHLQGYTEFRRRSRK